MSAPHGHGRVNVRPPWLFSAARRPNINLSYQLVSPGKVFMRALVSPRKSLITAIRQLMFVVSLLLVSTSGFIVAPRQPLSDCW